MDDKIINEGVEDSGESFVKDHGFAAVPIHFNPKDGAEKRIALVIPGVEPPLAFFRISGDTPDELSIEEIDGHVESVSQQAQSGEVVEESAEDSTQDDESETDVAEQPEEVEETTEEEIHDSEEEESTLDYPHEDDDGNPVAGFLIGNEDVQPPVIVVKPQDGESASDAMDRVSNDHPEHIPGTLDEATKVLGHSPLTREDN
jgi:hypothetical protein